jgi:hypothetical protein
MRSALMLSVTIINDAIKPGWTSQYNDGASTTNFICWTILVFFCIDIYELIKK